jgi:hypothetical protein
MTWGHKCGDWETSVDEANLAMFDYGEILEDDFVMTTCHRKESLQDAFWFSEHAAMHPSLELESTYIIHIAPDASATELLKTFRAAQEETG